ncbi:NADH-quinone oxidoreductase subunit NuoK [Candidatus Sumerlaeota bacterium]
MEIGLNHYLVVAAMLFALGIMGVIGRRNAIGILISIELLLSAANLNFVAFAKYSTHPFVEGWFGGLDGHVFAIFIIILAACEAAVALAIIINLYTNFGTVEVDDADKMKG